MAVIIPNILFAQSGGFAGDIKSLHQVLEQLYTGKPTQIDPLPPLETDPLPPFQIDPLIPAQTDPLF